MVRFDSSTRDTPDSRDGRRALNRDYQHDLISAPVADADDAETEGHRLSAWHAQVGFRYTTTGHALARDLTRDTRCGAEA